MNLADILSTPPTGRTPGTSPKRLPRRSHTPPAAAHVTRSARSGNAEPAHQPPATRTSSNSPPSDSFESPEQHLYPQLPDNHTHRIPGDQILQSLSHFHESDFDTSDPDFDVPSDAATDARHDDAPHMFGYYLGDGDSDNSDLSSDIDDQNSNMDDIDHIDLSETLDRAARPSRPGTAQNNHSHNDSQASSRPSPRSFHEVHMARPGTADRKRARPASRGSTSRPTTSAAASNPSSHQSQSFKRARRSRVSTRTSKHPDTNIPSINLVDSDDPPAPASSTAAESAAKLLSDSIAAQQQQSTSVPDLSSTAATKLTASTCSICMSAPREAIATVCGHLFCRACLTQWLGHAAQRARKRATCPSCRAGISVPAGGGARGAGARGVTVVNLEFKRKRAAPVTVG